MAPKGDLALAQVGSDFYVVTVPLVGGPVPVISVATPESAPTPVRRLSDIGGEFPVWQSSGRVVHWSIGNALVTYDLDRAKAFDDSVRVARRAARRSPRPGCPRRHGAPPGSARHHDGDLQADRTSHPRERHA
jgi:hypothetical protein